MPAAKNVTPDDRLELMVRVAELYYEHHKTQQEIADLTGISRSAVSRLLTAASDEGVVRIQVVNPRSRARELSLQLKETLGLHDALVVPTALSDAELARLKVARAAATYLVDHLSPGDMLGVGRGHTV
ncbi:MAG TPA: helix-turn-helix domain-containing protein, partial [Firmicutes bacterium]|nr:helix-turn-helix domain-containing protein [Bacillota bacterium]